MSSLRLFLAIDTPAEIKTLITQACNHLEHSDAHVKWEPMEKLHVTLKFLGNVDEHLLPEIVSYVEGLCRQYVPFLIRCAGIGCFPNSRSPRAVWAGIEDLTGELTRLHRAIDNGLTSFGFLPEQRQFHPHVTLGKVKGTKNVHSLLTRIESATLQSQPVTLSEVALFKSELRSSGSVYTVLRRFPLQGGTPADEHLPTAEGPLS